MFQIWNMISYNMYENYIKIYNHKSTTNSALIAREYLDLHMNNFTTFLFSGEPHVYLHASSILNLSDLIRSFANRL